MGIVTMHTMTRTRLICKKKFVLIGLITLLQSYSVRCIPLGIFSFITLSGLVLVAFPIPFGSARISHTLLCINLTLGGVATAVELEKAWEAKVIALEELEHLAMDVDIKEVEKH